MIVDLYLYLTVAVSCALDSCTIIPVLVIHNKCIVSRVVFIKYSDNENYCEGKQFPYMNIKL